MTALLAAPSWVAWAFSIQLILGFLVPPIPLQGRSIFLSDLWCWAWVMLGAADWWKRTSPRTRLAVLKPVVVATVFGFLVWAHGFFRPSVNSAFSDSNFFRVDDGDAFHPIRELVVLLRILSWFVAALLVSTWNLKRKAVDQIRTTLLACMIGVALLVAAEVFIPGAQTVLGNVYGFNPEFLWWRGRAYGPMRSPVESGAAMLLAALLIWSSGKTKPAVRAVAALTALFVAWGAHSVTPVLAAIAAYLLAYAYKQKRDRFKKIVPVATLVFLVALVWVVAHPAAKSKLGDLFFRLGPWGLFIKFAFQRWDLALLGFGMAPYHTDNSYLWVFNRAGLVGFVLVWGWVIRRLWKTRRSLRADQLAALAFVVITGFLFDSWIYRHVVMLMLVMALPKRSESSI